MADLSGTFNPAQVASSSDAASDAISKIAIVSDAASDALSKAYSRCATISDAASKAMSRATNALSQASDAKSAASDAISKIAIVSDAASDAGSKVLIAGKRCVILKVYNEASAIAAGDGKMLFAVPGLLDGMNLVSCGGHLYTAATSGVVSVQLRNVNSAVDMLTHAMEFDATEKDTATATSAAVINTSNDNVLQGEEIAVDIDGAGSGAKGLEVRLVFQI
jgi:hypothetical protein